MHYCFLYFKNSTHLLLYYSLSEFNSAITNLVVDTKLLSKANEKANRLAEIARDSVDAFIGAASSSISNISNYSVPRQRWIRAINKVMYDNYVSKYIMPLLVPSVGGGAAKKSNKKVTFQLPKIEVKAKAAPVVQANKAKKPTVSQAHTRKTVFS